MALSNWATLALDEKGQATNGVFTSPLGVGIEIYKSWLYVRDEKAWRDKSGYVQPTVMQVQEGVLHYLDVEIVAERGCDGFPESVYCAVWSGYESDKDDLVTGMVGIGTYGFSQFRKDPEDPEYNLFEGVRKYELEWLKERIDFWIHEHGAPSKFAKIDFSKALHFNAGDAFFASHLGRQTPAAPVGETTGTTAIMDITKAMREDQKKEE